jgi:hypothetical protein
MSAHKPLPEETRSRREVLESLGLRPLRSNAASGENAVLFYDSTARKIDLYEEADSRLITAHELADAMACCLPNSETDAAALAAMDALAFLLADARDLFGATYDALRRGAA